MFKPILAAAAVAAALATSAFAQQQPAAQPGGAAQNSMPTLSTAAHQDFVQTQHATDWLGSKLIGATVYGPDNASIGNVNDLLFDNNGKIRAVVIGVGGFLGVAEKDVAIAFDSLNITRRPDSNLIDKITVTYSKDELKNAPTFAYYEPGKSQTMGSGLNSKPNGSSPER
jgi:hypothetical protein